MYRTLLITILLTTSGHAQVKWKNLFNGKDLSGWKQLNGKAQFESINGEIIGTSIANEPNNSFLVTEETFDDFILELEFKLDGTNSGVQVRSESKPDYLNGRVHGYQVDFDPTARAWTGGIYDESRRGWIYPLDYNRSAKKLLKPMDWNMCRIECLGNSIRTWINGQPASHLIDDVTASGFIALQIHAVSAEDVGKQVRWRNIRIQTNHLQPSPPKAIFIADLIRIKNMNQQQKGFQVVEKPQEKKVDIFFKGQKITSYTWYDSVMKTVLHPINTLSGITITREFPLAMKSGERADHPHQLGMFFTHESVNGYDFWNLSTAISPAERSKYGKIEHNRVMHAQGWEDDAYLTTVAHWKTYQGKLLLEETARFHFHVVEDKLIIDRTTQLKAIEEVTFYDKKDALIGLRVARELELANEWKDNFVMPDQSILKEARIDNDGVTGKYFNSQGQEGEGVWGKRAKWLCLQGKKENKVISIALIDHPKNIGFPTYWHARGYGLMAANPLGEKIFTERKSELNLKLAKNETVQFMYRAVIGEMKLLKPELDALTDDYARQQ